MVAHCLSIVIVSKLLIPENIPALENALEKENMKAATERKKEMKRELFSVVADQSGKIFDENVLTIVWARRFAGYKRANLMLNDLARFFRVINKAGFSCQVIWAGKPYSEDKDSIDMFNEIIEKIKPMPNCAILTGYELGLSALLKRGSDVWLNNPKIFREASGTSGMTAAMNGSVNLSIPDGWVPEFARHGKNCFSVEPADRALDEKEQNRIEATRIYDILENEVLPIYYNKPEKWFSIMRQGWQDVRQAFDSNRMAEEYYEKMYK